MCFKGTIAKKFKMLSSQTISLVKCILITCTTISYSQIKSTPCLIFFTDIRNNELCFFVPHSPMSVVLQWHQSWRSLEVRVVASSHRIKKTHFRRSCHGLLLMADACADDWAHRCQAHISSTAGDSCLPHTGALPWAHMRWKAILATRLSWRRRKHTSE